MAAIGIANQRETVVVWDRATGKPIHNAIIWQDRRTAPECAALREARHEETIAQMTGLLADPYFSATKLAWLLDHVEGARDLARAGRLAAGTVDTFTSLASDRRSVVRHRRHQRGTHDALRYQGRRMERGACLTCSACRQASFPRSPTAPPISA